MTTTKKANDLAKQKLDSSGLTPTDAKKLKMKALGPSQTNGLHKSFKPLSALQLNYYGVDGKPLPDWPQAEPFYRIRYLEKPSGFDAMTDKKEIRYVQLPDTAPVAYYPQNFDDWPSLAKDHEQPLIITEGELKAAKACKEGFPTLGLGGVYNWRSNKLGLTWLPSLDLIKWTKRHVYICFDSDYRTNPMVLAALRELGEALQQRGSFIYLVSLPTLPGLDKCGLDDFLVHAGSGANQLFGDLLSEATPLGLTAPLWHMNDQYVYVRNPGLVVTKDGSHKVSPSMFKDHLEAPAQYHERVILADGTTRHKPTSAAGAWLKWPLRTEAARITYRPGQAALLDETDPPLFNTWPGWGVTPKKGKIKPFLDLVDHLFTGAEPEAKEWFLNWCAYPLQHPGVKMFTSAVLHGIRHGTGKSLVGYTLGKIYGDNFTEISQDDLHSSHNEWAENKQFVMGDDVTGSNKRQDADYLKKLITQRELRINIKYVPSFTVPDCINYFFTANHPDSFFLEDDDRRHFIHEVVVGPLTDKFYQIYDEWLAKDGAAALFDWLRKRDTGDFNPAAPAFRTSAKDRMTDNVRSDLASWVRMLLEAPEQFLTVGSVIMDQDLFTSKELLMLYDPDGRTGTTANGMGRELARAGVRQVLGGRVIRLPDKTVGRYYAIRHPEKWLTATHGQLVSHITGIKERKTSKRKKY